MKLIGRMVLGTALCLAVPLSARAQYVPLADNASTGITSVGAFVGMEFDAADHPLALGADGRLRLNGKSFEINPRLAFRPFKDGSMKQFDVNVVHNYALADPGRIRPFIGVGIGVNHLSFDEFGSDTAVGLNLVSGARLAMRPGAAHEPFIHLQYTILNDRGNSFTAVIGTSFSLR